MGRTQWNGGRDEEKRKGKMGGGKKGKRAREGKINRKGWRRTKKWKGGET